MRIMGVDPGTGILGFGVIESKKGQSPIIVDAGVVSTPAHTPLPERLEDIYNSLTEIIQQTKPDVVAIEKLFFTSNITTAISVAEARGVAELVAQQQRVEIAEYTPLQIKQTLTGYGRADKKQVQEMVKRELKLDKIPKPDDAADALAAALTHHFMTRRAG
jgi:crossover junction endodeoxyribonuclease RuvC